MLSMQTLYDTIPIPASLWDEAGNVIGCNNAMVKFLNCGSKENCIERFFAYSTELQPDGIPSTEKAKLLHNQTAEFGQIKSVWTHLIDNEVVDVEITVVKMEQESKLFSVAYVKDMRELLRRQAAEDESRAKTRFLARMSHEIRTPMNAVLGITEMQMQKEGLPPETEEAFSRIYSSSNLLLSIINDILDLSKVEAGKMEILNDVYDVASMLVDTVQLNLMHVGSKPIEFILNVDEHVPALLIGDELRIKQVMNNILSNAFKYTDEGSISLDVKTETDGDDVILTFSVKDTGQGMTGEQINSLFEIEFTRFNMKSNRIIEGSGLGMNIAYHLTEMMGGAIDVNSTVGEGTTFTVRIPQTKKSEETLGKKTVESLQSLETAQRALKRLSRLANIHMPYGKVLVVDDVESNLYVAKGLLMPYKLTVETVDSGRAAVHKIRNGNVYDIIFMDHMMPGMDGVEATRKILDMGYKNPIVALTANTVLGQSELFMKNGFSGFISKPIDVNQLNTYLLRMIRDKQPPEVLAAAARDQEIEQKFTGTHDFPAPGGGEVSARLKESFVRDAKRSSEAIAAVLNREHIDVEAFKIYIIHTHAMKSALYNVGEQILSTVAGALEQAGREGDTSTIFALTAGFLTRLGETTENISENLAKLAKLQKPGPKEIAPKSSPPEEKPAAKTLETKIFVVDDSDTNLILAEEALEECYEVFTIMSAAQMFKMLEKVKPNLILLDIQMPETDGFEAMEKIKEDSALAAIPVVFLTATITPEISARARSLGAADIVAKPFSAEDLRRKVEGWLAKPGAKPTILIIDDTPMVISALSRMLLPLYSVKVAKDGEEGLKIAARHPIDLVLLDLNMPGISGFDVLAKLREAEKTRCIPVIFITGSEEIEDEALGFSLGAVDYIKKPFVEENVLHRVELHVHGGKI